MPDDDASGPISFHEVQAWFREYGPRLRPPAADAVESFTQLLELIPPGESHLCPMSPEAFEAAEPAAQVARLTAAARILTDHLPSVIHAAKLLSREMPRLTDLGRKAAMSRCPPGVDARISGEQLDLLVTLHRAAAASRSAFTAPVFQFEEPTENAAGYWHRVAELIIVQARERWLEAGNRIVGAGKGADSPTTKMAARALERLGFRNKDGAVISVEAIAQTMQRKHQPG